MGSESTEFTVAELVKSDVLEKPLDGNHGGTHPKGKDFIDSGIPFIMASDMSNGHIDTLGCKFISRNQADSLRKGFSITGDVLFSHKATIGRTALVGELDTDYVMLTPQVTYYRVKDKTKLNNRYLKYYFDSREFQDLFNQWAGGGSTRAYLGITAQLKLPIKLPKIDQQKAIAHILGSLDDKIELNRQMNETLESMAQALFKSWFVDFDPVIDNALAEGNAIPDVFAERAEQRNPSPPAPLPEVEGSKNNLPLPSGEGLGVRELFPSEFEYTEEMGWIPKGWGVESFDKLAKLDTTSVKPNNFPEKMWEHFSIPAFDTDRSPVHDLGDEIKSNKYKVNSNSVLVSKLNPETERIWWPQIENEETAICSTEFMQFIPCDSLQRAFVYSLIRSEPFQREIKSRVTGSTGSRQRAQPKSVAVVDVIIPADEVIKLYSEVAERWMSKVSGSIIVNNTLTKLRDTLLPKLLSGELRIPDAEKLIAEAI